VQNNLYTLHDKPPTITSIINAVYIDNVHCVTINPNFITWASCLGCDLQYCDMTNVMNEINYYVGEKTYGKINDITDVANTLDTLYDQNDLLLISLIYFDANWLHPMCEGKTQTFVKVNNQSVQVATMMSTKVEICSYYEDRDITCVEKVYDLGQSVFGMMMPKSHVKIQKMLNVEHVQYYVSKMDKVDVKITMPIFNVNYKSSDLNMVETIGSMGIVDVFGKGSGLIYVVESDEKLRIANVFHSVVFSANTGGTSKLTTEYTTQNKYPGASNTNIKTFVALRPFVWYVRNVNNDCLLFSGMYNGEN
jgi:serine protease inhibitor